MRPQSGFSLLELAIVIVILAAILGSVVVPLATQVQAKKIKETEQLLEDVKEALMGFALSNGRLPCPDTSGAVPDGNEDPCLVVGSGPPTPIEGFLPWNTLGVNAIDAWGRVFYYSVVDEFTGEETTPACSNDDDDLDLCDHSPPPPLPPGANYINVLGQVGSPNLANNVPAVVASTGPNGSGGTELAGNILPAPVGANENNNLPASATPTQFVLRPYFDDAPAGCVDPACNFDDLVVWLSTPILFNRMVAAGRLP